MDDTRKPKPTQLTLKVLFGIMCKEDASDLYITEGAPPSFRIKGEVTPLNIDPLTGVQTEQLAISSMSEKQRVEFSIEMNMNHAMAYEGMGRFRINVFRQQGHVGMVVRKITTDIPTLKELDLPEVFKDIVMKKRGLVIVVGATSSGKSTTLAAMIDHRNSNEKGHIITVEDPIEFVHKHKKSLITQREVGTDCPSFQSALKNTLRQAPDAILVGEIRDKETMEHALEFAETGHLCLATLHANSASQALERIMNFFPEEMHNQLRMGLSLNLGAIISQRLIKTKTGGRKAVIEILINTPRISDLIKKGETGTIKETMAEGENYGMQTFDQCLFNLWNDGHVEQSAALVLADSENNLKLRMDMHNEKSNEGEVAHQTSLSAFGSNVQFESDDE